MLNILPLSRKNTLRKEFVSKQARFVTGVALVATGLAVGLVLISDWTIQRWLTSGTAGLSPDFMTVEERDELKTLVANVNVLAGKAQPLLKESTAPVTDILSVIEATPDDIQLHALTFSYTDSTVQLSGTAANRDTIINFQKQLEHLPTLKDVNLPLSELSKREDIYFSMSATYEATQL